MKFIVFKSENCVFNLEGLNSITYSPSIRDSDYNYVPNNTWVFHYKNHTLRVKADKYTLESILEAIALVNEGNPLEVEETR